MAARIRDDDGRPNELLEEGGRIACWLGVAVAWASGLGGAKAKMASDKGSGAWKRAAPLSGEDFAAGLFKERCRTRNPVVTAVASNAVLVGVDGAESLLSELGVVLPPTVTARSRRGLHRYYRPDEGCKPGKIQIGEDGVVHSDDGYLCMPPSLHESGVIYQYVVNGSITTLPAETHAVLLKLAGETTARIETAFEAGEKVPENFRNNFVFHRALDMAHAGLTEAEILPSMLAVGRDRCAPPLDEAAVKKQVASAVKRARVKPSAQKKVKVELERDLTNAIAATGLPEATPIVPAATKPGVSPTRHPLTRRRVNEIEPRPQEWLLPGLVLIGAETLLAGVGGLGKSTLACQWVAELTTGKLGPAGTALMVSFEDAAEEVVRPRLQAAGADLSRVFVIQKPGGVIVLPDDLRELAREAQETEAKLIVIDPVSASLSLKLDAHKDQDVRVVLAQLERVAGERKLAVVLIAHLNKAPSADAYVRVSGSTGFYNASRSVVTVTPDPDDETCRLIAQHKSNGTGPAASDRAGRVPCRGRANRDFADGLRRGRGGRRPVPGTRTPRVEGPTKRAKAATLLTSLLADGEWHERAYVEAIATGQGIGRRTLETAVNDLVIESELHGFPATAKWRLPVAQPPSSADVAQLDETA
jgi:AAA domain/Bifunctional DNA primase/polymerase, N-terminal/Primase C terminal 1 (PriCT-1)